MIAYEWETPNKQQMMSLLEASGQTFPADTLQGSAVTIAAYDGDELIAFGGLASEGELVPTVVHPVYAARQVDENIIKLLSVQRGRLSKIKESHVAS